jgi:hypothetical protein
MHYRLFDDTYVGILLFLKIIVPLLVDRQTHMPRAGGCIPATHRIGYCILRLTM